MTSKVTSKLLGTSISISSILALALASIALVAIACSSEEPTPTPVPPAPNATAVAPTSTAIPPPATPEPPETEVMEPTGDPIRIGTLIDTTGDLAIFGPQIVLATDLAALLINEAGGIGGRPVELIHRDSGTSPQIATDAASALVNVDGVEAIVGSLSSGVTLAVAESVTIPNGVVLVSPASTSPAITNLDDNDTVFRTTVSDALQGVIAAQAASQLGYENVATIYINNAYGEGLSTVFQETFEGLGGTVSAAVPIEGGQASYASELRQASQGGATVLMAMSYPETAGVYLREAVEGQFFSEFMFVDGTKNQEMFDDLGADNFEGNYGTAPGAPGTPTQKRFQDLYASKLDGDPSSIFISEAFDAAVILALAIAEAGSEDGDDIKTAMREVANAPGEKVGPGDLAKALQLISEGKDIDYVGAAGDQDFDAQGDVQNTIEVWKIDGGQISSTGIFASPGESIDISAESTMMEPSGEPIKIGTLIDATGDLAVFGPPIVLATDLAALLINEAGGIDGRQIEMIHRDSGTSPQIATDAASALVNVDGIEAIVGSLSSGVSIAVAESVTIPNGAVLVSPASTSPALSSLDDNDLVFRTTVSDAFQGVILAQLANELGYENVATMYINNAYGEGLSTVFSETFESLGGTVSASVPIEGGQASYTSELRQASQGGATVLMAMSYPETAGVYLREAVEGQFFDEFMFVDGTKNQEMFDSLGADNFEGNYGTAPGAPGTPSQTTFKELYSSKLGGEPSSLFISEAFDATTILALAIAEAGSEDGDDIKVAIRKVANAPGEKVGPGDLAKALQLIGEGKDIDYVGAAGEQEMDENGDVFNTIEVWKIEGGQVTSTGIFVSAGDSIQLDAAPTMKRPGIGSEFAPSFAVGAGSKALFKVDENLRGADVVVSLETETLNGVVDFRSNSASVEIDLHTLMSDQSRRDRYVREQLFPGQPVVTVHFADLGDVPAPFIDGKEELKTKLTGTVNVNGTDADLEFDITARLDNGTDLVILGTSKFVWADFGMEAPVSQIFVVEDEVTVEILLQASTGN